MTLDVHVVSHTHWDREWYQPLERFRQRLVALVDELLDDPPARGESFLLDGQAIVIEDYLAVRPERESELRALLAEGRLEAGPWYVLADELIPSGEALVRNLFAGRRSLHRLGASSPPVLYCPDSFGHPAALPAIAAGFGLPLVLLWRGYGSMRWPQGDTATWAAPAGDAVLLFHLPRDGYEFGSHLPTDPSGSAERWSRMRAELAPRSATGVLLIQNGADHHARQLGFHEAIDTLERAAGNDNIRRSSLAAFATALVAQARSASVPSIAGELRDSYGYTWTLQGTFATRAHEKRLNAIAERALVRGAEPWAAIAALTGADSRRPLVNAAWRTLLEAHPHDTLCGCSIDEVANAMEVRVRSATTQARGIRDDSIAQLIGHDAAAAHGARDRWMPIVVVPNAAARAREGVAIIDVEEFIADVRVGPGSAPDPEPVSVSSSRTPVIPELGPLQVLSRRITNVRIESPRHYPDNDLVAITRVAAWLPRTGGYSIATYPIEAGTAQRGARPQAVATTPRSLDNGLLSIEVDADGNVGLTHIASGRRIAPLIDFVDESDVGDLYTPAPRPREHATEVRGVRRVHRGPLRGELALTYRVISPAERSRGVDAELVVHLTLDAGAEFLRVSVQGDNRRENHRLRIRFHGDVASATSHADAAFGVVARDRLALPGGDAAVEHAPPTAPLHRYVSLFDDGAGMTLFSDGLAEYESPGDGSLLVTLVRSVGELSRNDLPERPGHAGWPSSTPGAQCLGAFEASFGLLLHGPRTASTIDAIERTADDVLLPLRGTTLRSALRRPEPLPELALEGVGLAFSSCKETEAGGGLALRCVNLLDEPVDGRWCLPFQPISAKLARLDEMEMSDLEMRDRSVRFTAPARGTVTIVVR